MNTLRFDSSALSIEFQPVDWDSDVIGNTVMQVEKLEVRQADDALSKMEDLLNDLSEQGVALATCRIPHYSIQESMILEGAGFKFIEMVLHPFMDKLTNKEFRADENIIIEIAQLHELEEISRISEVAFINDRFSIDYRIPPKASASRYKNWVLSCENHPSQKVVKFSKNKEVVGFFIIEEDTCSRKAYWHLTAISPQHHGQGLGAKCWQSMLADHKSRNITEVLTTISARNTPVLNLYSKLNFRFKNPEMTFHWVNEKLLSSNNLLS